MRIKNRLTPYPILNNYSDDYVGVKFSAVLELTTQFSEIKGSLSFTLDDMAILDLIHKNKASYVVHIESPSTCFRKKIISYDREIEFAIKTSEVANQLEIRTFVVLNEDIKEFYSDAFHPDYTGQKFDLSAHQIIAIGTAINYDIERDDKDLEELPSVLQIMKIKDSKKGTVSVNTDDDKKIIIGLTEEVYDLYANLGRTTFKSTAFGLIIYPAMIVILERMQKNKDDSDMNSRHWFITINNILEKNGFKLDDLSIENDSLLSVCQAMFSNPIKRSFDELEKCSERMC